MNGQIDWSELFFSANGRAGRMPSLIAAAALLVIAAFYEAVAGTTLHWITGWFVYPPCSIGRLRAFKHRTAAAFEVVGGPGATAAGRRLAAPES